MIDPILQHNTAAQLLDERLHGRETQAAANALLRGSAIEAFKNALEIVRSDP